MAFPENSEQVGKADLFWIEDDSHHLSVARHTCKTPSVSSCVFESERATTQVTQRVKVMNQFTQVSEAFSTNVSDSSDSQITNIFLR